MDFGRAGRDFPRPRARSVSSQQRKNKGMNTTTPSFDTGAGTLRMRGKVAVDQILVLVSFPVPDFTWSVITSFVLVMNQSWPSPPVRVSLAPASFFTVLLLR